MAFYYSSMVLFCIFMHGTLSQEDTICLDGWSKYNNNCYKLLKNPSNWHEANTKCGDENNGGYLTDIKSQEEQDFVKDLYDSGITGDPAVVNAWIGLKLDRADNKWKWSHDNSEATFTKWAPGEPNGADRDDEDCVELVAGEANRGMWNDHLCTTAVDRYAICKAPAAQRVWVENGGQTEYLIASQSTDLVSWWLANAYCLTLNSALVTIDDNTEQEFLSSQVSGILYDGPIWTGLNRLDKSKWRWINGENEAQYTNWDAGFPNLNINFGTNLCGNMMKSSGKWQNQHCDTVATFICERKKDGSTPIVPPDTDVGGFCPDGYFGVGGNKCYKVVHRPSLIGGWTFADAALKCSEETAGLRPGLASVHSIAENAVITAFLNTSTWGVWIGHFRQSPDTNWLWADNTPVVYNNFGPGEPNGEDNCAEVWSILGQHGKWNNINCEDRRGYVCEIYKDPNNVINTPKPSPDCTNGYTAYTYGCYKTVTDVKSWDAADAYCRQDGGNLVSIHYNSENAAILTQVAYSGAGELWTGFAQDLEPMSAYNSDAPWIWSDGWAVQFTQWAPEEPSNIANGGCASIRSDGLWYNNACDRTLAFICRKTDAPALTTPAHIDGVCPREETGTTQWIRYGSYCYYFETDDYASWTGATLGCLSHSPFATLVSVHTEVENTWVSNKFEESSPSSNGAWIGMFKSTQEETLNQLKWYDGTEVQYTHWAPGEPNGEEREQCIHMYNGNYKASWNDDPCDKQYHYICKVPVLPQFTLPTTVLPSGGCPNGWVEYGDNCYKFFPNQFYPYTDAEDNCVHEGGHLASVHSWAENIFIRDTMKDLVHVPQPQHYWIGLVKNSGDDIDKFYWLDGTPLDFDSAWGPGEPNNGAGAFEENCVEGLQGTGIWNDIQCGEVRASVCKVSKGGDSYDAGGDGLSGGAVAGIIFGVLAGVLLIVAIVVFVLDRKGVVDVKKSVSDKKSSLFGSVGFQNQNYARDDLDGQGSNA